MKKLLKHGDVAPSFHTTDIFGNVVSLNPRDGWTFLSFHRFAACPFCTMRTHELVVNAAKFHEMNIQIISIWPSNVENMLKFVGKEQTPFPLVSDAQKSIFEKYKVVHSSFLGKLLTLMHAGVVFAALKYRFKNSITDGDSNLFPADFLISPSGQIALAHYSRHFGDHLSIEHIISQVQKEKQNISII